MENTEQKRVEIKCELCQNSNLTFNCFCYKCKTDVATDGYAIQCPNEDCCSFYDENSYFNDLYRGRWIRTKYHCSHCNVFIVIYDVLLRYHFYDKLREKNGGKIFKEY